MVIFIGSNERHSMQSGRHFNVENVRSSNPTAFVCSWSAANNVKRVQTSYIKNFRYLMMTGCGNTIVSRWRCHSRGRKHRDQAIKWIRLNIVKSPSRQRCPKPVKNYQISPLPLFNSLSSQEKAVHCRILENKVWEWKSLLRESFDQ